MTSRLHSLCIDALDPAGLAAFWAGVLRREPADAVTLLPADDTGFPLRFQPTSVPKQLRNRMHFDLTSSSLDDQQATVARALELGGRHLDVGQRPEEGHVVLADPDGNEFCVLPPGNAFLAGCGFLGALSCDGSHQVGSFWSEALGWPLVWDQDEETAIQAPYGGPKITWGGPPVMPKPPRNRMRLDLASDGDQQAEVDRLVGLGATRVDGGPGDRVELADPEGNEFGVLPR
ncbi:MAG: VOC family protein [Nocardioidaceae bacterium]|nr:VOC family protein [Nocardioidaceae bacterium]